MSLPQNAPAKKEAERPVALRYAARRGLIRWFKERFGLKQRKLFWIGFAIIGLITIYFSGILISFFVFGTMVVLSALPFLRPVVSDLLNWLGPIVGPHIQYMNSNSPIDKILMSIGSTSSALVSSSFFNEILCILLPCIGAFFVIRATIRPDRLLVSSNGIQLQWTFPFNFKGPLLPWTDIRKVSYVRPPGTTTQGKSLIAFECNSLPFIYRLTEKVSAATKGNICLQFGNIESDKDREALSRTLQTHAPAIDAAVLENLTPAQNQSYTELWLGALTAPSRRERAEPLKSGVKLNAGQFEVLGQLGAGGQGTAYLATGSSEANADQDSAEIVLKEFVLPLYVDTDSRKSVLEKFVKEADILKSLDNPRIVKLMDCFIEDHRGYLVLERIKGHSLKSLVEISGPMPELKVSSLLHQMCEMLEYLHSQSPPVVHRDFAPDNLILDEDGTLKLVDFNVAQQTDDAFTGTIVGKQSYVPPEQLRGMATAQSDIYALGATLYFLLTGEDPEPLSVSHPRALVSHISEQIDEIVARCTQLEEEARFKSASEIANSLRITIPWAEEIEKQKR